MTIELSVVGVPYPQGSKSAFVRGGRAVLTEGSSATGRAGHAAWRQAVATATRDYLDLYPRQALDEAIRVTMHFYFPLTADRYRTRHRTKPDLSKLIRATEDAMVDGGLLRDDSLIYALTASKWYAHDRPPGCVISIDPMGDSEAVDREARKQLAAQARKQTKQGDA